MPAHPKISAKTNGDAATTKIVKTPRNSENGSKIHDEYNRKLLQAIPGTEIAPVNILPRIPK